MSLLTDRQIKARCIQPSHFILDSDQRWNPVIVGVTHTDDQVKNWVLRGYSRLQVATAQVLKDLNWRPMISPFQAEKVRSVDGAPVMSFGVSSMGYDIQLADTDLKVFTDINSQVIDPLDLNPKTYVPMSALTDVLNRKYVVLPPKTVLLGHTPEFFDIPRNILVTCLGKSTYARCGVSVIVTPLEPEWDGQLVVEVVNHSPSPVKIYLNQGIAQLLFHLADEDCELSYRDAAGKYQGQTGTTDAKA